MAGKIVQLYPGQNPVWDIAGDGSQGYCELDSIVAGGGSGGGGAATIADGADVAEGAVADAVVAAGATGTLSAKLRRLTTDLGTLIGGTVGTKDNGPSWTSSHGIAGVPFTSSDQHSAAVSVSDAPTSGQKLVITDLLFSADTAMSVTFKCETTGAIVAGPFYVPANTVVQITPRGKGWKLATADKKLQVLASVSGNIMCDPFYYSEA